MDLTKRKIADSIAERKRHHLKFLNKAKSYKPFLEVEKAAFAAGALDTRHKELMALCVSIVTQGPSPASRVHSDGLRCVDPRGAGRRAMPEHRASRATKRAAIAGHPEGRGIFFGIVVAHLDRSPATLGDGLLAPKKMSSVRMIA